MSVLQRASDKLSMFRRAIAVVGVANALRLQMNRGFCRRGLAGFWPVLTFSLPNNRHKLHLRTGLSDCNVLLHIFLLETYDPSLAAEYVPKFIIDCGAIVCNSGSYLLNKLLGATIVRLGLGHVRHGCGENS